jgi:hypothetical protein
MIYANMFDSLSFNHTLYFLQNDSLFKKVKFLKKIVQNQIADCILYGLFSDSKSVPYIITGVKNMNIQNLLDEIETLKVELEKFDRGNKSAGTRARKSLQNIKTICQDIRNQIQDIKKKEDTSPNA